jgi:hypothetical protein
MDELRARGFEVHGFTSTSSLLPKDEEEVAQRIGVLALGITGEVFTANQHVMSTLGLNAQATARLIKALHINTIPSKKHRASSACAFTSTHCYRPGPSLSA